MDGHDPQRQPNAPDPARTNAAPPATSAAPAGPMLSPWVRLRSPRHHPFIYRKMVDAIDPRARPGDVVQVYDRAGRLFGRGLFNPDSQIAVRMLLFGVAPVDDAFWISRLQQALALRRGLGLDSITDAQRLVHAEGDGLSGLIVERYADVLVFELFSRGMYQRARTIAAWLTEMLGPPTCLDRPQSARPEWLVVLRADERVQALEKFALKGGVECFSVPAAAPDGTPPQDRAGAKQPRGVADPPESVVIREHGIRYRVNCVSGHKTGFFCDQRRNRRQFANLCRDASVLDLCCYTGGFGLAARLLGQARDVTGVDLDETALELAKVNANLNQTRIEHVHADAFTYGRQMLANGRKYGAVVLDPPKLAQRREDVDDALRKYHDLNRLACAVCEPGGFLLTCSCSGLVSREMFTRTALDAARRAGRRAQILRVSGADADHPVAPECPESEYLKALLLRIL